MYKKNILSYVARMTIFAVVVGAIWGGVFGGIAAAENVYLTVSPGSITLYEGQSATVTATINPTLPTATTLKFKITTTAPAGDYTFPSSVTIPANSTTGTVTFTANDNHQVDSNRTVTINMDSSVWNFSGGPVSGMSGTPLPVTIKDAVATLPTLTICPECAGQSPTVEEGQDLLIPMTLSSSLSSDLSVTLTTTGTAVEGIDYTLDHQVVVPADKSKQSGIRLSALQSPTTSQDRTVVITAKSGAVPPVVNVVGSPITVIIKGAVVPESAPAPYLIPSSSIVTPGGTVEFSIEFLDGATPPQQTSYTLEFGGTASANKGYSIIPPEPNYSNITFAAGESGKKVAAVNTSYGIQPPKDIIATLYDVGGKVVSTTTVKVEGNAGSCIGGIAGKTSDASLAQSDHGVTNFNSHDIPDFDKIGIPSETVDLKILGIQALGYAPAKEQSACVTTQMAEDHPLKGYVWNTNLGFISFFCDGNGISSGSNLGIDCGMYQYGVKLDKAVTSGVRKLSGEAWNPAFGYISFSGNYNDGAGNSGKYGVDAVKDGTTDKWNLFGYGWTQAGVYLDFTGMIIEIPTDEAVCIGTSDFPCCLNPQPASCGCTEAQKADKGNLPCYCSVPEHQNEVLCCSPEDKTNPDNLMCYCSNPDNQLSATCVDIPSVPPITCKGPCCEVDPSLAFECNCTQAENGSGEATEKECCILDKYKSGNFCKNDPLYCSLFPQIDLCVEFSPEPTFVDSESLKSFPVADCSQGYGMELFLRNEDGDPKDLTNETLKMWFEWSDTVRMNQVNVTSVDNSNEAEPFSENKGGVVFKPLAIEVNKDNINEWFDHTSGVTGHYKLKEGKKIKSCAPTTAGNVSLIKTVPEDMFVFDNEKFFGKAPVPRNDLILSRIVYEIVTPKAEGQDEDTIVYGDITPYKSPAYFKFRPWLEVSQLDTTDLKDTIAGYRDIPINVDIKLGNNGVTLPDTPNVSFNLGKRNDAKMDESCKDVTASTGFNFVLNSTAYGVANQSCTLGQSGCSITKAIIALNTLYDLTITPILPLKPEVGSVPQAVCTKVPAPTLDSTITYMKDGKTIKYYSNKLPRLDKGALENTAAIIHGTIYSAFTFSTDVAQTLSPSGSQVSNMVRDTVHQQVAKYIKSSNEANIVAKTGIVDAECVIEKFDGTNPDGQNCGEHYKRNISVGEGDKKEMADYFYGVNVDLGSSVGNTAETVDDFEGIGKRILVVEGGNLLINKDVYNGAASNDQLVIAVFSVKSGGKDVGGNVYIADDVTTLSNVAIIADGSVYPFPAKSSLNGNIGEKGVLSNPSLSSFYGGVHQDSSQLFIKGAVSAKTSAGISSLVDIDKATLKGRHLNGAYETVDTILKSMYYDWNMFRLYRGGVFDVCDNGLVKDLSCGKCLTVDDQLILANNTGSVCGEPIGTLDKDGQPYKDIPCPSNPQLQECDGIQAVVGTVGGKTGDLLPGKKFGKESPLSRSNKPFYLYYSPIDSAMLKADGN